MRFSSCHILSLITVVVAHSNVGSLHARRLEKRQLKLDISDLQKLGDVLGVDIPSVSLPPIQLGPLSVPEIILDPTPTPEDPEPSLSAEPEPSLSSAEPEPSSPSAEPPSSPSASESSSVDPEPSSSASVSSSPEPVPTPSSAEPSVTSSNVSAPSSSASETTIVAPPTSVVPTPTSSSSQGGGIISDILDPITSAVLPPVSSIVSEITSVVGPPVSSIVSEITSVVGPPVSSIASEISSVISDVVPPPSSVISEITSAISSIASQVTPPPVISSIISNLPSITLPPISEPSVTPSEPPVSESSEPPTSEPSQPPSVTPSEPPISQPSEPPISQPSSEPPISEPPISTPSSVTPSITISFPSGISVEPEDPSSTPSSVVAPSSIDIDPGLSFILTESSLALAPVPTTTTVDPTLSDPDQATAVPVSDLDPTASTTFSVAALPTGLPNKIYPVNRLPADTDLTGMTLISILFSSGLNWPFVVGDWRSSSQIFAWVPVLIATSLDIGTDAVKTYALQVFIPTTYRSPADASELGTMWLGYVPSDMVDTLAASIKARNSRFYNGASNAVARQLAQHVNSGFSLLSVPDPNGANSGTPGSNSPGQSGATSDGKSRQDAIIGVVSALGAIALLVLIFLVYRSLKRRKEMAHRRLSDPPDMAGYRPEGREFDQDSVGGQRRRSFYYAEDSLRGFQQPAQEEYSYVQGGQQQMSQMNRRNVVPATISAPILRENSMNW